MAPPRPSANTPRALPLAYTLFFLWIEPVATAAGAYWAHFQQAEYMRMTARSDGLTAPSVAAPESIVLTQLANMYLVFALTEALVLRVTRDRAVWRVLLAGLLLADLGHLYSCRLAPGAPGLYLRPWEWNAIYWGNLGFVYVGAALRSSFLLGLGLGGARGAR